MIESSRCIDARQQYPPSSKHWLLLPPFLDNNIHHLQGIFGVLKFGAILWCKNLKLCANGLSDHWWHHDQISHQILLLRTHCHLSESGRSCKILRRHARNLWRHARNL
ncbi:hypothetical protein AAC387_Pa07g3140 [Persea americana]